VRSVPFREDVIALELLGSGKYDLPAQLADRLIDVHQPPWADRAPQEARSSATGRGVGVVNMLSALEQLLAEVPFISSVHAGWRSLQDAEWPQDIDLIRAGQGNIAVVYFSVNPDFRAAEQEAGFSAANEAKGGVDFNPAQIRPSLVSDAETTGMVFSAETAEQLRQAAGVEPVIVNVSPLESFSDFSL
jgi:hypothetical protein